MGGDESSCGLVSLQWTVKRRWELKGPKCVDELNFLRTLHPKLLKLSEASGSKRWLKPDASFWCFHVAFNTGYLLTLYLTQMFVKKGILFFQTGFPLGWIRYISEEQPCHQPNCEGCGISYSIILAWQSHKKRTASSFPSGVSGDSNN